VANNFYQRMQCKHLQNAKHLNSLSTFERWNEHDLKLVENTNEDMRLERSEQAKQLHNLSRFVGMTDKKQ